MKKLLLILLLLIPFHVKALEPNYKIDSLNIESSVLENGDLLVKENITLTGDFNGYIRDIGISGGNEEYDPAGFELIRICDSSLKTNCFIENKNAQKGETGFYYLNEEVPGTQTIYMFNYTEQGTKTFYIEYLLKDVVLVHDDVAELYYTFIGDRLDDDVQNVDIKVYLPKEDSNLRVWAHGPLNGTVYPVENRYVHAQISPLYKNSLVDLRIVFDKNSVQNAVKNKSGNALSTILVEEEARANEANKIRQNFFMMYLTVGVWIVGAIVFIGYIYYFHRKGKQAKFNLEYHREFPNEYSPSMVGYLMEQKVTSTLLSATILNIVRKGKLKIEEKSVGEEESYSLIKQNTDGKEALTMEEEYVLNWLIDDMGDGTAVELADFKKATNNKKTSSHFIKMYNGWIKLVEKDAKKENLFTNGLYLKLVSLFYIIIGLFLYNHWIETVFQFSGFSFLIMILCVGLVYLYHEDKNQRFIGYFLWIGLSFMIIYLLGQFISGFLLLLFLIHTTIPFIIHFANEPNSRTEKGTEDYAKWSAFKNFLDDFGRFEEKDLPEIVLWDKYLVYATVFGLAKKVAEEMEIKLEDMGEYPVQLVRYISSNKAKDNKAFYNSLISTIQTSRFTSRSRTVLYDRVSGGRTSSGRGSGGGFSSGGGHGGGGRSGGGRGF